MILRCFIHGCSLKKINLVYTIELILCHQNQRDLFLNRVGKLGYYNKRLIYLGEYVESRKLFGDPFNIIRNTAMKKGDATVSLQYSVRVHAGDRLEDAMNPFTSS